jgi:uncharacterized membrane protein
MSATAPYDADRSFTERVLARVAVADAERARRERVLPLVPLLTILVVGAAWLIALDVGVDALRLTIRALAWFGSVGQIEQHLSTALLGPFAWIPLAVSVLLFVAALVWVRAHQPDPPGGRR